MMQTKEEAVSSDALRVDRDVGHIELGVVDCRTFEIVSGSARLFSWLNRSPLQRVPLCEIVPGITPERINAALRDNQGVCELQGKFVSSKRKLVTLRMRLIQTGKSDVSPLRLLAFDVSELRRKEEILKTVSGYLEAHKNIISESRKTLKALLDSLPQAVFMLDRDLKITSETSAKAAEFLGGDIQDRSFIELTQLSPDQFEPLELAFAGVPWDLMAGVLPREFIRNGHTFSLKFVPLFEQQMLIAVTVIIDDVSEQRRLQNSLKQTDSDNRALVAIISSRNEFHDLVALTHKALELVDNVSELRPLIHSLKGGFSFFECDTFAAQCHAFEEELNPVLYNPDEGRRFLTGLIDDVSVFLRRYSEILHVTPEIEQDRAGSTVQVAYHAIGEIFRKAESCRIDQGLLEEIERLAEIPVSSALAWLDKAWMKTLAREGKEGKHIIWEGDAQIAREPYKELFQSFVHIIRNAVAHGIQTPEERVYANKNRAGTMKIRSSFTEGMYRISFKDDGIGIDVAEIRNIAQKRGISVPTDSSREAILALLCEPDLSSRTEVTELSGRGMGLDAVRRAAESYGGGVTIESELGVGTTVTVWFKRQQYWRSKE